MNILIVEDEVIIATHIAQIVKKFNYKVAGLAHNKADAIKLIDELSPDMVLLDINIETRTTGIEIGKYLQEEKQVPFVYITAHSDMQIVTNALHTQPSAYIIKPFKPMDIYAAINIALQKFKEPDFILVKDGYDTVKIMHEDILWLKADNNYVDIKTEKKVHAVRMSLEKFESELPLTKFIRIHRSYIVNKSKITKIYRSGVTVANAELPVSRNYRGNISSLML